MSHFQGEKRHFLDKIGPPKAPLLKKIWTWTYWIIKYTLLSLFWAIIIGEYTIYGGVLSWFFQKMVKNVKILAESSQFWTLGVSRGSDQNYFLIIIFQLFKIYLFCEKTFTVWLILANLKPKWRKMAFLRPWRSRNKGLGGWGVKYFFWQQHNDDEKMCGNFGGFSLETFRDK